VVRSLYPIVSIFELNKRSGEVPATRLEGSQDALETMLAGLIASGAIMTIGPVADPKL
jgi:hypothetical protein